MEPFFLFYSRESKTRIILASFKNGSVEMLTQ